MLVSMCSMKGSDEVYGGEREGTAAADICGSITRSVCFAASI